MTTSAAVMTIGSDFSRTARRRIRTAGILAAGLTVAAALGGGDAQAAAPSVEEALALAPKQKGVDYDRPTAEDAKRATMGQDKVDGVAALVVRGPAGEVLRAFADTNGNRVVDRWSYFKNGVEVYRDIDSDHDTKVDQSRWLNSGGSRWGLDTDGNGTLDAWKVLSAEEATAEAVAAVRDRDAAAFARLLPSKADLQAAGFEGQRLDELVARVGRAAKRFPEVAAAQKQLGGDSKWASMLTPQPPGILPAGAPGVAQDVTAYDNLVALVENASGSGGGQIYIGSLVRCGQVWRPIDVPQVMGEGGEIAGADGFFSPQAGSQSPAAEGPAQDERLKPLMAKLQDIENKMAGADGGKRKELAVEQLGVLDQVVQSCAEADRGFWLRQLVETLSAYVQEGLVPDGIGRLEKLVEAAAGDDRLAAFTAFRLAQARYSADMQQAGADGEKLQDQWFDSLKTFVETYPQAPEAAEAMLQLAFRDEFEGREKESIDRYQQIVTGFAESPQARKAAGAVRRLESVGKPLALAGTSIDGRKFSADSLRGVPVLVHYWSTDCEPCKVDLAQIRELQAKFGPKKFGVVGVALDGDKAKLTKFLQAKPLPWPQLHEPGGLDSRLAEEYGVLALPTMMLVDAKGNVVDRNVSITELERKLEAVLGTK
jgi:thiol-disulfide isomerase/thioredoxin